MWRIRHTTAVGFILLALTLAVAGNLMNWLEQYYSTTLYNINPMEGVMTYIQFSLVMSAILCLPLVLYHLWRFTTVEMKGKWTLLKYLVFSMFLFVLSLLFSIFLNHIVLKALQGYGTPLYSIQAFYTFLAYNTLFTALIFQLPLLMKALKTLGIINKSMLKPYRKHILLATLIITGVLTPDGSMVTQILLTLPFMFFFEVGLQI